MTMKLTVKRFRTRRPEGTSAAPGPVSPQLNSPAPDQTAGSVLPDNAFMPSPEDDGFGAGSFPTAKGPVSGAPSAVAHVANVATGTPEAAPLEIDSIRREGLTGRQLRIARRLAQKHGLPATSDFDAVRLLRARGIDPFQANAALEVVSGGMDSELPGGSRALALSLADTAQLPQVVPPTPLPSPAVQAEQAHIAEVMKIQRDIARRRRRKSMMLMARLGVFVLLPTLLAGIYYYIIASPIYASRTEFVIQQAEPAAAAGMSSLLRGTQFATSQDSVAVQGYLQSQGAMQRLEADKGFRSHFSGPDIDAILRLPADASEGEVFRLYQKMVKVSYDPTEGLIKMEVKAADPDKAVEFSNALISYAEDQVDKLTQRLREDQMKGALQAYQDAETKLEAANRRVVDLQEQFKVLNSEVEAGLVTGQISQLESQLTADRLSLAQMESNESPNQARMEPLKRRIATIQSQIAEMRAKLTEDSAGGVSIAKVQSQLLVASADVQTRQMMMAAALQSMETARLEANRQTRYLSIAVTPVRPDEAAYPRAFENTLVVLLIFTGIYLMISMTVAILREQITA